MSLSVFLCFVIRHSFVLSEVLYFTDPCIFSVPTLTNLDFLGYVSYYFLDFFY